MDSFTLGDYVLDDSVSLKNRLYRVAIEARRLGNQETADWCRLELDGYQDGALVPSYRQFTSHIVCTMFDGNIQRTNAVLPYVEVIASYRANIEKCNLGEGVQRLTDMMLHEDDLSVPVSDRVVQLVNYEWRSQRRRVVSCKVPVPVGAISQCLGSIERQLIEKVFQNPNLEAVTIRVAGQTPSSEVSRGGDTIYHDHSNTQIIQIIDSSVQVNNFHSLQVFLERQGVERDQIAELQPILESDNDDQLNSWIDRQVDRLTGAAKGIAKDTAKSAITKILTEGLIRYGVPAAKLAFLGYQLLT